MARNKRITQASYYRYLKKRYQLEIALMMKDELGAVVAGSKEANNLALNTAVQESVNWVTDQAIYHQVRALVKNICEQYGIPTRYQGLFMAWGEKILANYFLDKKGDTLANMLWDYVRKLMKTNVTADVPTGYIYVSGRPVNITRVLRDIALQVGQLVNVSRSAIGGAMSTAHLHVTG